jgi:NTE family protein
VDAAVSPARSCRGSPWDAKARAPHANVLVLQGGGALGAYHLGVIEELTAGGIVPDWVCGVSIGAVNAAILAGNRPEDRLRQLGRFWEQVSASLRPLPVVPSGSAGDMWSDAAGLWVALMGVPGFFAPRFPPARWQPRGSAGAVSHYDLAPLRATLDALVDWDRLNDGPVRVAVAWYWDGGIASNAPVQHVFDSDSGRDKNIFQVDLFPAAGPLPETMDEVEIRAQDIRFSSRTRVNTRRELELAPVRALVRKLLSDCAPDLGRLDGGELDALRRFAAEQRIDICQIVYRDKARTGRGRGHDFSRAAMEAHRAAGRRDAADALAVRDWRAPPAAGVRCDRL